MDTGKTILHMGEKGLESPIQMRNTDSGGIEFEWSLCVTVGQKTKGFDYYFTTICRNGHILQN